MTEQVVFRSGEGPFHRIRPDLAGVLIGGEKVTLVRWDFPVGRAPTPVHSHAEHEQFCIMLSGSVRTMLDGEEVTLHAGEGIYIDSTMGHAYVKVGEKEAVVLGICTSDAPVPWQRPPHSAGD